MAMMQQQKDFFVQAQVQAVAQAQAQSVATQAQAAATLAGQQQLSELLGSPLPRILVNSAVTSIPVSSQFVVKSSNDVCDTPVLSMAVLDSAMSLQPCSSSNFLSKPPLTTEVPDTNPSIPLGSPKGQYANLGQEIRAQDQGHMKDSHPAFILPSTSRLQRARDRIRDRSSRTPPQLIWLFTQQFGLFFLT